MYWSVDRPLSSQRRHLVVSTTRPRHNHFGRRHRHQVRPTRLTVVKFLTLSPILKLLPHPRTFNLFVPSEWDSNTWVFLCWQQYPINHINPWAMTSNFFIIWIPNNYLTKEQWMHFCFVIKNSWNNKKLFFNQNLKPKKTLFSFLILKNIKNG
jgi:hypothetical protein